MAWAIPGNGEIDRLIETVRQALTNAHDIQLSGLWTTPLEQQTADAIQRYLDGPVLRWALTGYAYYGGADEAVLNRWKNAAQSHINAAADWGVKGEDSVSIALDVVAAVPENITKDVAVGVEKAGKRAGEVALGVAKGVVSSGFGILLIAGLLLVGYLRFKRT
jgi:hypothetical protein